MSCVTFEIKKFRTVQNFINVEFAQIYFIVSTSKFKNLELTRIVSTINKLYCELIMSRSHSSRISQESLILNQLNMLMLMLIIKIVMEEYRVFLICYSFQAKLMMMEKS